MVKDEEIDPIEKQFNLRAILKELDRNSKIVQEKYSNKFCLLNDILERQTHLMGIYYKEGYVKKWLGSKYNDNVLLNNTLFNMPYRIHSILLLEKNNMYGAARMVIRQHFEELILAKFSEIENSKLKNYGDDEEENNMTKKWHNERGNSTGDDTLSIGRDVFSKLKGKEISELKNFWRTLNKFTHATTFAMQPLIIPSIGKEPENDESRKILTTQLLGDIEYTLDMTFALLVMNFHLLIGHMGRKAYGWEFGYPQDSHGMYEKEKRLKSETKDLIKAYFNTISIRHGHQKYYKRIVFQYRQNWQT